MKNEKIFNFIGFALGFIIIIVGIVLIFNPAHSYSTESVSYCSFGGDFYTEQYAATKAAVSNTAVTANNIRDLGEKLALYFGLTFVITGSLVSLAYGKLLFCTSTKTESITQPNNKDNIPNL